MNSTAMRKKALKSSIMFIEDHVDITPAETICDVCSLRIAGALAKPLLRIAIGRCGHRFIGIGRDAGYLRIAGDRIASVGRSHVHLCAKAGPKREARARVSSY
jgi:hypothetical protein